jgi:hypothetical protein
MLPLSEENAKCHALNLTHKKQALEISFSLLFFKIIKIILFLRQQINHGLLECYIQGTFGTLTVIIITVSF